tara:strand:- start:309 stop:491 length:183 start_codon:yes stop_codon:yes gene_type:complete
MKPIQKYDASHKRKKNRKTIIIDGNEYRYDDASTFKQTYHWQRSNLQVNSTKTGRRKKKW